MRIKEPFYKVANIIEEARIGGPQIRILNVAAAITPEIKTTVILPKDNSKEFIKKLKYYTIHYKIFKITRITKELKVAIRFIIFSIFEIIKIAKFLNKEKFDLVHISGGSWQYKGLLASKIAKHKVVWHINDTYSPWFIKLLFFLFRQFPNAYIFASKRSYNYYRKFIDKSKYRCIIPAPVDTNFFFQKKKLTLNNKIKKKHENKIVIGMVANISPIKGLDIFIKIVEILNKKFSNLHFVVIGNVSNNQKSLFRNLQKSINKCKIKNIFFYSHIKDLRPYLKRIDIYVCTSNAESSPISVWEAMSMSKPIVSTNVGDVPRYLVSGKSGEIVQVGNAKAISKKLEKLIRDSKLRLIYGNRARKIAVKNFDIKKISNNYKKFYKLFIKNC